MIGMAAGRDGREWSLCRRCWADGLASPEQVTDVREDEHEAPAELALPVTESRVVVKRAGGSR